MASLCLKCLIYIRCLSDTQSEAEWWTMSLAFCPGYFSPLSLFKKKIKINVVQCLGPTLSHSFLCCFEALYGTSINYSISVFEKHLPGCQIPDAGKLDSARNQSLCAKYCCWLHSLSLRVCRSLIFCSSVKRWQDLKTPSEAAVM